VDGKCEEYMKRYKSVGINRSNNRFQEIRFRGYWLIEDREEQCYEAGLRSTLDYYRGELDHIA